MAHTENMHRFFSSLKTIWPSTYGPVPLRAKKDGNLLKDRGAANARWREHFEELLNRESVVDESFFDSFPQLPVKEELGETPNLQEVRKAINQFTNHLTPGADEIPAAGGDTLHETALVHPYQPDLQYRTDPRRPT